MPNVKKFLQKQRQKLPKSIRRFLPGSQKIVIPKGVINYGETVMIEVPEYLKNRPVVVARPKSPSYHAPSSTSSISGHRSHRIPQYSYNYIPTEASMVGPHMESWESGYNYSDPARRQRGFDPYVHTEAFKKNLSLYQDFDPYRRSTPQNYVPSQESVACLNMTSPASAPKSYLRAPSPGTPLQTQRRKVMPRTDLSPADTSAVREVMFMMDRMEVMELEKIQKDLRDFQSCRRRLIFDVSSLSNGSDAINEESIMSYYSAQS